MNQLAKKSLAAISCYGNVLVQTDHIALSLQAVIESVWSEVSQELTELRSHQADLDKALPALPPPVCLESLARCESCLRKPRWGRFRGHRFQVLTREFWTLAMACAKAMMACISHPYRFRPLLLPGGPWCQALRPIQTILRKCWVFSLSKGRSSSHNPLRQRSRCFRGCEKNWRNPRSLGVLPKSGLEFWGTQKKTLQVSVFFVFLVVFGMICCVLHSVVFRFKFSMVYSCCSRREDIWKVSEVGQKLQTKKESC